MIKLRPFEPNDIELFREWLHAPHVRKWYTHPENWLYEVKNEGGGFYGIYHFIVMHDGRSVGFCQYYEYRLGGEAWHGDTDISGAYSIDYLIGEPDCLRRGIGKAAVCALIEEIKQVDGATKIIVQPDENNAASCALLRACGFSYDRARKLYCLTFPQRTDRPLFQ